MSTVKRTYPHVEAAKCIRQELKKAFPTTKFSVRSDSFSMGDAVRIGWTNGPTTDQVNAIVRKYQYGHFDSQTDCYEISNNRKDIPQTQFVQVSREFDKSFIDITFSWLKKKYIEFKDCKELYENVMFNGYWRNPNQEIRYILWNMDLTNGIDITSLSYEVNL